MSKIFKRAWQKGKRKKRINDSKLEPTPYYHAGGFLKVAVTIQRKGKTMRDALECFKRKVDEKCDY